MVGQVRDVFKERNFQGRFVPGRGQDATDQGRIGGPLWKEEKERKKKKKKRKREGSRWERRCS
ncbi:hypothetical protein LX36DRAFT_658312 [Colletotrichum falcatum]|nr:hypothetical protein LX36DRAFT_658312 [Colletotrichum falcatum]